MGGEDGGGCVAMLLRFIDLSAEHAGLRHVEKIGPYDGIATRVYQIPNIGVSRGNYAVERSVNLFKRYQRGVLLDYFLVFFDNRFIRVLSTDGIVDVLLRHSIGFLNPLLRSFVVVSRLEFAFCAYRILPGCL